MRLLSRNSYVRRGDSTVLVENETDDVQKDLEAFQAEEKVILFCFPTVWSNINFDWLNTIGTT